MADPNCKHEFWTPYCDKCQQMLKGDRLMRFLQRLWAWGIAELGALQELESVPSPPAPPWDSALTQEDGPAEVEEASPPPVGWDERFRYLEGKIKSLQAWRGWVTERLAALEAGRQSPQVTRRKITCPYCLVTYEEVNIPAGQPNSGPLSPPLSNAKATAEPTPEHGT